MAQFYFSVNLDNDRVLCIAPITEEKLQLSGHEVSDQSGYFLYEYRESERETKVEIIAQLLSEEAVLKLREMFKMS